MNLYNFLWSREAPSRYYRHSLFWLGIYVFFMLSVWIGFLAKESFTFSDMLPRFRSKFYVLLTCMAYSYITVYVFLPKMLYPRRYFLFTLSLAGLTLLSYAVTGFIMYSNTELFKKSTLVYAMWIHTVNFLFIGPPVVSCLFLASKMVKTYFEKMEEKVALVRENANAELQMLKAQVHPHFLFNTLNNIYSFTLSKSPEASKLVMKLSAMLKYMTNECEYALVPLEKELMVLKDYIDLEKVRYGSLKLTLRIKGDPEDKLIAPLLLIPFVENSFKHGSSKMLEHPWIDLDIAVHDTYLIFKLGNSKPETNHKHSGDKGIGLSNVQKRLQLLYPKEADLELAEDGGSFRVLLRLPLHVAHERVKPEAMKLAETL